MWSFVPSFSPFNFSNARKLDLFANYLSPFLSFFKQRRTKSSRRHHAVFLSQKSHSKFWGFFAAHKVEVFSQPNAQGQGLSVRASIDMEIATWELPQAQNAPLCWRVTGGETGKRKSSRIISSARVLTQAKLHTLLKNWKNISGIGQQCWMLVIHMKTFWQFESSWRQFFVTN